MRIVRTLIALAAIAAAAATGFALLRPESAPASGQGPGMSLSGPGAVSTGETFTIEIKADPPPKVPSAGFSTEVYYSTGLQWILRPACEDENRTTVNGGSAPTCVRYTGGRATHSVGYAPIGTLPPLPLLDEPLGTLVELDFRCRESGTHRLALMSSSHFNNEHGYSAFYLPAEALDVDGDGSLEQVVATLTVTCLGEAPSPTACALSGCPLVPGMSLSGPSAVTTGETFTIDINADPPPGVPIAGFASEVVFPPGLSWVQGPTCEDENQTRVNGGNVGVCVHGEGPDGEARHVVVSEIAVAPVTQLDTPLETLIELDILCTAPGIHTLTLTAAPDSSFGVIYFDALTNWVAVKTASPGVADTLTIECSGEVLPYTPTVTGTATPTHTPTPTPCPDGPCPTPTVPPCPGWPPDEPQPTMCLVPDCDGCGAPIPTPTPTQMVGGISDCIDFSSGEQCAVDGNGDTIPDPGMSLSGPSAVSTGQTFTIDINADAPPIVPLAGFATEVLFPPGLSWVQRPTCEDENQATVNGGGVAACVRAVGPNGEMRQYIVSSLAGPPPLLPLDAPLTTLVQIDVLCTTPGTHTLTLTAVPPPGSTSSFPFGAIYFDIYTTQVLVKTAGYDIDGNTDVEQVADTLTVDCAGTPLPTTGPPPTSTPITPPTSTPCPTEGCPTSTPSPTATPTPTCPSGGCPQPGMSVSGPAFVVGGESFTLSVNADPAPSVGVAGFQTELLIPNGVAYVGADCQSQNQTTVNAGEPGVCVSDGMRHAVVTAIGVPPLPAFDGPLSTLLEIEMFCKEPGTRTFVLTALPQSPFGAAFFDTDTIPLHVRTELYDVDGDTTLEEVAGTFTMTCGDYPTPPPCWEQGCPSMTATPTPTDTPCTGPCPAVTRTPSPTGTPPSTPTRTPTCPTDMAPQDGTCAPVTATPIVSAGTPAHDPPLGAETPADDFTPSPTLFSEVDPDPAVITPAATDFSEVSPALATPRSTALGDVQSPDAGDGSDGSGSRASLAIGLLVAALFTLGATALWRLGPAADN